MLITWYDSFCVVVPFLISHIGPSPTQWCLTCVTHFICKHFCSYTPCIWILTFDFYVHAVVCLHGSLRGWWRTGFPAENWVPATCLLHPCVSLHFGHCFFMQLVCGQKHIPYHMWSNGVHFCAAVSPPNLWYWVQCGVCCLPFLIGAVPVLTLPYTWPGYVQRTFPTNNLPRTLEFHAVQLWKPSKTTFKLVPCHKAAYTHSIMTWCVKYTIATFRMGLTWGWSLFAGCLPKSRRWIACVLLSNGLPKRHNEQGHRLFTSPVLAARSVSLRHILASRISILLASVVGSRPLELSRAINDRP